MPPLLQLQKLPGKGDGGWRGIKKCLCVVFVADQKIVKEEIVVLGEMRSYLIVSYLRL